MPHPTVVNIRGAQRSPSPWDTGKFRSRSAVLQKAMETKQILMAPLPSARSRREAKPELRDSFICPRGTLIHQRIKYVEITFHLRCPRALVLHRTGAWVCIESRPENTGSPAAAEAGSRLARCTGWVLPRKAAGATALVPAARYGLVCPRGITWPFADGVVQRHQQTRKSLPGEQQPAF